MMPTLTAMPPSFSPARCMLRVSVLLSVFLAFGASYSAAAARPGDQESPSLTILLRTSDGAPVAGIGVILRSASIALGGPATPMPTQEATTDATGQAPFQNLEHWVWYATFSGAFAGHSLQLSKDQGKPPWGTNPAGDGFPLVVDPQLENEGNLPIIAAGATTATDPFVLVLDGATWIPGLDLADSAASPVPLDTVPRAAPPSVPAPVAASNQGAPSRLDLSALLLLLVVGGAGIIALYQSWRQRTTPPIADDGDAMPPHLPGD